MSLFALGWKIEFLPFLANNHVNKNNTSSSTDTIHKKNTPIGTLINETKERLSSNFFQEIQSWLKHRGKDKITHDLEITRNGGIHDDEQKYYHIFTQKEITDILESVGNLSVMETQHYKGSWVYIVTKTC